MNKAFDHNGVLVSASRPVKQLRTVKKTVLIDSADRDFVKYHTNGDVVYYLPRTYQNVISIRLKSAQFPPLTLGASVSSGAARLHSYSKGQNTASADFTGDATVLAANYYFLLELEGLNKSDETVALSQRSSFIDNFFARIPVNLVQQNSLSTPAYFIDYNDHSLEENVSKYSPPIQNLDRLRVKCRLHSQQDKSGFMYWTGDGNVAAPDRSNLTLNYSIILELEMLENGFDEFSSFETRIHNKDAGNFGC